MRWRFEEFNQSFIKGWFYDERNPEKTFTIVAVQGDTVIGKAKNDERRDILLEQGHARPNSGFTIQLHDYDSELPYEILCLNIQDTGGDLILHSHDKSSIGLIKAPYQNFNSHSLWEGASLSGEKLLALDLPDLKGKVVLDIGCNEGFFCQYALQAGAKRVVGIDHSSWFIEKAQSRVADYENLSATGKLEYLKGSWWDIPQEKFDLILFLSALHYEAKQKEFLDFLSTRLSSNGKLVLECGAINSPGEHWLIYRRSVDTRRFPTRDHLVNTLLSNYAVRFMGESVMQAGDPVPRAVYHCSLRRTVAVVIRGKGGSGKSSLLRQMEGPSFSSDYFLSLYIGPLATQSPDTPMYRALASELKSESLSLAADFLIQNGFVEEFCRDFVSCLPLDCPLVYIEGQIFTYAPVFEALVSELEQKGVMVWDIVRSS